MQLRLDDPALIPDLRQHFERSGFAADPVDAATIEVWQPEARSDDAARDAVENHLAIWRAVHADVTVVVV
jgi:hypothetical protein